MLLLISSLCAIAQYLPLIIARPANRHDSREAIFQADQGYTDPPLLGLSVANEVWHDYYDGSFNEGAIHGGNLVEPILPNDLILSNGENISLRLSLGDNSASFSNPLSTRVGLEKESGLLSQRVKNKDTKGRQLAFAKRKMSRKSMTQAEWDHLLEIKDEEALKIRSEFFTKQRAKANKHTYLKSLRENPKNYQARCKMMELGYDADDIERMLTVGERKVLNPEDVKAYTRVKNHLYRLRHDIKTFMQSPKSESLDEDTIDFFAQDTTFGAKIMPKNASFNDIVELLRDMRDMFRDDPYNPRLSESKHLFDKWAHANGYKFETIQLPVRQTAQMAEWH